MKTKHWIMVFVGLALVLLAILLLRPKQSGLVGIYRDGRLIETVDLTKDRTIPLDGAAGGATAAVQDGEIYMESAECPDQICVAAPPRRDADRLPAESPEHPVDRAGRGSGRRVRREVAPCGTMSES